MSYDFLIVGAGLFGASFARAATDAGARCLVVEKADVAGGSAATRRTRGVTEHLHGPHIFHTRDEAVWAFVGRFARFLPYRHTLEVVSRGKRYPLPINMGTFEALWGARTEAEARAIIDSQTVPCEQPETLEAYALATLGRDLYETLIRDYTQKQWGRPCDRLPAAILKRLTLRFDRDNRYFGDALQGVPEGGYTPLTERMLEGIDVRYNTDYLENREQLDQRADRTLYTGAPDALFGCRYGRLAYRTLRFETQWLPEPDYQGAAVVNYADADIPYTRVTEFKHFEGADAPGTLVMREYPAEWREGANAYYPVGDEANLALYARYRALADGRTLLGGRLGLYQYLDMDKAIRLALDMANAAMAK